MTTSTNERTFHATHSGYSLPNDSVEHERLDEQSRTLNILIGDRPFLTDIQPPLENGSTFYGLDVGCGTGFMTTLLAQMVPANRSTIYGVDISAVPNLHTQQPNVEYVQANIMEVLDNDNDERFQRNSFDFVTHRMLVLGISDWHAYLRTCYSLLKPGGQIELQDCAMRWYNIDEEEISHDWIWLRLFHKGAAKFGLDLFGPESFGQLLKTTGFEDVEIKAFVWTSTEDHWERYPESDAIGKYTTSTLNKQFPIAISKMLQKAGFTTMEDLEGLRSLEEVTANYCDTLTNASKGTHCKFYVATGRKPRLHQHAV